MNTTVLKQYPRLAAMLLAIAEEEDVAWATSVIDSAKNKRSPMSIGLVREAFRKRRTYHGTSGILRASSAVADAGEMSTHFNPPLVKGAA